MGLSILSVAYPFAPVTPDPPGGAEQVLAQIDRALVAAGHRSTVIACEGSAVAGKLVSVPATDDPARDRAAVHAAVRSAIAANPADLIHLHGLDFADYLPPAGPPVVATLHLPLDWYPTAAFAPRRADITLVPVSANQAARAPAGTRLSAPIGNGVDIDHYRPGGNKSDYVLVLGRVAPEKGFHDALDAARIADMRLLAAGQVFPYAAHRRYFEEQVKPHLDDRRRWLGPVAGAAKARLLAEARAVLIPSTAPETSSLVAMEALASGTPVIAYRAGALPDIVEHGVTGLIVDDVAGMAAAIRAVHEIELSACRYVAVARYSVARTTAAYLDLYRSLL